jgi:4-hydroxy-3-polyprenylbenzoate decarboxylase
MKGKLDALVGLKGLATAGAKEVKRGKAPVQEIVLRGDEVDLTKLPVLTTWPEDGGPFITLPLVVTSNLKGRPNVGMYRLQVFDRNTTGMHIHEHHDGAKNLREWAGGGRTRVPVSVALGADPVTDLLGHRTRAADDRRVSLSAASCAASRSRSSSASPTTCSFLRTPRSCSRAWSRSGEMRWEGPFGDHTGYYSLADDFPVFHVEAITMRRDAIYPTTIVGRPPMEDCYMAKATERIFLPVIRAMMPEVIDYDLPLEGVFHNCAIFQIKKEFAGQAFRVMNFAWSMGQMMFTKYVIVVDEDVDCHDYTQVAWRCFNNVDPSRDILISKGPLDRLDHASNFESFGYKMGIDATRPIRARVTSASGPRRSRCPPMSRPESTPCGASSALS